MNNNNLLTYEEAAGILKCTKDYLERCIVGRGRLPRIEVGPRIFRISETDVYEYLDNARTFIKLKNGQKEGSKNAKDKSAEKASH